MATTVAFKLKWEYKLGNCRIFLIKLKIFLVIKCYYLWRRPNESNCSEFLRCCCYIVTLLPLCMILIYDPYRYSLDTLNTCCQAPRHPHTRGLPVAPPLQPYAPHRCRSSSSGCNIQPSSGLSRLPRGLCLRCIRAQPRAGTRPASLPSPRSRPGRSLETRRDPLCAAWGSGCTPCRHPWADGRYSRRPPG